MKNRSFILVFFITIIMIIQGCTTRELPESKIKVNQQRIALPRTEFKPEKYVCYKGTDIIIDGKLNETSWQNAEWTEDFVDIEGNDLAEPLHQTHVKILWDNEYLYIAAEIFEPHIWAYLKQRDTVIFYDNDFEVFIDPDGDTHGYYEFEINALNTVWDLLLTKPYRDQGQVLNAWNINGLKSAVNIYGSINDPSDLDEKWIVELAFPFSVLEEWGNKAIDGRQWRINFSRVNWRTTIENGIYKKELNPATGKRYPEFNWVWSPQGVINMHAPETWAYLQFSDIPAGSGSAEFRNKPEEAIKWNLRQLYYAQRAYASENNKFADNPALLYKYDYDPGDYLLSIILTTGGYEARLESGNKLWIIDDTGRVYDLRLTIDD